MVEIDLDGNIWSGEFGAGQSTTINIPGNTGLVDILSTGNNIFVDLTNPIVSVPIAPNVSTMKLLEQGETIRIKTKVANRLYLYNHGAACVISISFKTEGPSRA